MKNTVQVGQRWVNEQGDVLSVKGYNHASDMNLVTVPSTDGTLLVDVWVPWQYIVKCFTLLTVKPFPRLYKGLEVSHVAAGWQWTGYVMGRTFDPLTQLWGWSVAWEGLGPNGANACDQTGIYDVSELTVGTP